MHTFPIQKDTCSATALIGRILRERAAHVVAEPLPLAVKLNLQQLARKKEDPARE